MDTKEPVKIVLGCYDEKPHPYHYNWIDDSWVLTDINPRFPHIKKVDAQDIPYDKVGGIYASHILEHVAEDEVVSTLKHWREKMVDGSQLTINVPNALWGLDAWMKFNNEQDTGSTYFNDLEKIIQIIHGDGSTKPDTHKSWFSKDKMQEYLKEAGFSHYKIWLEFEAHDMECVIAEVIK